MTRIPPIHVSQLLLCTNRSGLCDAAHGAGISAGTAVDALAFVDGVVAERVVHIDCALGAAVCAGTAGDAAVIDNVHSVFPPYNIALFVIVTRSILTYNLRLSNSIS